MWIVDVVWMMDDGCGCGIGITGIVVLPVLYWYYCDMWWIVAGGKRVSYSVSSRVCSVTFSTG
jgi:hypothetical protein